MTTVDPFSKQLQYTLGFTPDDLTANRAGFLGKQQDAQLRQSARPFWRLITICGVFAVVILAILVAFAGGSREAPMLYMLMLIVPGGLCAIFGVRLAGIYASVGDERVTVVEGLATTYTKSTIRGGVAFYVRIGTEEFFVSRTLQSAFEPGHRYRVYYTPKGRIIVSAEWLPVPTSEATISGLPSSELAAAIGFQRDELDANRTGRLSTPQAARLRKSRNHHVLLAVVSGLAAYGFLQLHPFFGTSTTGQIFWGLLMLFPVLLFGASTLAAVQRTRDLRGVGVRALSGRLERSTEGGGSTRRQPTYFLQVDGEKIHVPLAVYGAFTDGGHYTLYVAPHSRVLLSAEPKIAS
jgi:hypothetical protein